MRTLRELDLSWNYNSKEVVKALAKILKGNDTIHTYLLEMQNVKGFGRC